MDFERAIVDPSSVFDEPEQVCDEQTLSRDEKIDILRRWEYDVREMEVADEENMGGASSVTLDDVLQALRRVGAGSDAGSASPTKQGGT